MQTTHLSQFSSCVHISLSQQRLHYLQHGRCLHSYQISTAKNGAGQQMGSECTPTGWHRIRAKIGQDLPEGTVFIGRRPTGEYYSEALARQYPRRDWILTRILWLSGLERGHNRFGSVDTARRYIYIHGSPAPCVTGYANSHGCIRMQNCDITKLFERIEPETRVYIG